jgi:hypothetical protein
MIIIGGVLQENPFFVPPDEFLAELRARRAAADDRAPRSPDGGIRDGRDSG